MRKILILLALIVVCSFCTYGQSCIETIVGPPNTWTATPDSVSVQTCLTNATTGDTVIVSQGASTWTSTPTISGKTLTIVGQTSCTGSGDPNGGTSGVVSCSDNSYTCSTVGTCITLNYTSGRLIVTPSTGHFIDLSGFTFINDAPNNTPAGTISLFSESYGSVQFRVHGNHFVGNALNSIDIEVSEWGLMDHNWFENIVSNCTANPPNCSTTPFKVDGDFVSNGYTEWASAASQGTNQAVIVEQNYFTNDFPASINNEGLGDCYFGAQIVFRFNTGFATQAPNCHGYDSGGFRSALSNENYENHLSNNSSPCHSQAYTSSRGGYGIVWGNIADGTCSWGGISLIYNRYHFDNNNSGGWGEAASSLNWVPIGTYAHTNGMSSAIAIPWVASSSYTTGAVIGPTSNNAGQNVFQMQGPNCTSGSSQPTWSQTAGGTTNDGTCTGSSAWVNVSGAICGTGFTCSTVFGNASSGVPIGGWLSTAPDTQCTTGTTCSRPVDNFGGTYPYRDQPGRGNQQSLMPWMEWSNTFTGTTEPFLFADSFAGGGTVNGNSFPAIVVANQDFYDQQTSGCAGTQTTGVCVGTLAARAANCTVGVAYWATDQGNWNVSGNGTGNGILYECTSANVWTQYYEPYTYPDPLDTGGSLSVSAALSGTGIGVVISPTSYSFTNTVINSGNSSDSPVNFKITNNSGSTISAITPSLSGTNFSDYSTTSGTCSGALVNGSNCNVTVTFTPTHLGNLVATLSVSFTGATGSPVTSSLNGLSTASSTQPAPTRKMFTINYSTEVSTGI